MPYDWRKSNDTGRLHRTDRYVEDLVVGATVRAFTGSGVELELTNGERVWLGASGHEVDINLDDA
jgi:hypothetical protein